MVERLVPSTTEAEALQSSDDPSCLLQPTASMSPLVSHTCHAWSGARAWTVRADVHATETILPDLSRDVVVIEGRAQLVPRSSSAIAVHLDPGKPIRGLRLPIAATEVFLDPSWFGWRDPGVSAVNPTALWDVARADGALGWTSDPGLERFLRLLDVPGVRLGAVALALNHSDRTLRRRSVEWLGASPVATRGLLRDWRFLRELHRGSTATAAAAKVGFADVAHASRELRRFAGGMSGWTNVRLAD